MKILIYEPLPDINRGKFIAYFARALIKAGFDVNILLEESLIYTECEQLTPKGVLHNRVVIAHYFQGLPVSFVKIPKEIYDGVTSENLSVKLSEVCSARFNFFEDLFATFLPEKIFIWNGGHDYQQDFINYCANIGLKKSLFFAELAWFSQKEYFYFDPIGVNGASSISVSKPKPLNSVETRKICNWLEGFNRQLRKLDTIEKTVLVPLQLESDTSITEFSPFSTMLDFLNFLDGWLPTELTVYVRNHPLSANNEVLSQMPSRFLLSGDSTLYDAIEKAEYVVGINSTVLLESLALGKKVYAFGKGVFSSSDAIFTNSELTREFRYYKNNEVERQAFLYDLVFNRQVSFQTVYECDIQKLMAHLPFDVELNHNNMRLAAYNPNFFDKLLGRIFYYLFFMKKRVKEWI